MKTNFKKPVKTVLFVSNNMCSVAVLIVALSVVGVTPLQAEGWNHGSAPMGQFEGYIKYDNYELSYGCSGLSSSINIYADGMHIAAGDSTIVVDGVEAFHGSTTYDSVSDATKVESYVKAEWGNDRKALHNALIDALSSGSEAIWTTSSGKIFAFDLTGSSKIENCRIY